MAKTSKSKSHFIIISTDFHKVKNQYPFYSKIPHQIFAKLYTQLEIYLSDKNQLKNLLKILFGIVDKTIGAHTFCQ